MSRTSIVESEEELNKMDTESECLQLNCFLCYKFFTKTDVTFHLFNSIFDNNKQDFSISSILSKILSFEINTSSELHSKVICTDCHEMLIEYEMLEKQFLNIKNKINDKYNDTLEYFEQKLNEIEFGEEEDLSKFEDSEYNSANGFYVYQIVEKNQNNIIDIESKIINKEEVNHNSNSDLIKDEVYQDENSFIDYASMSEEVYVIAEENNVPELEVQTKSPTVDPESLENKEMFIYKKLDERFSPENLLQQQNKNNKSNSYICDVCGRKFISKYTIKAHMKLHTARQRNFKCSQCDKSFYSQSNLLAHEKTHSDLKEYKCEICDKFLSTQHNLDLHKMIHTGIKPFICQLCGSTFGRRVELQDHERVHTGEKPFKCDICSTAFAQRSNLQTHKRTIHFNVKLYKCDTCGKSFKRRRLLGYHITSAHTTERPIKCKICPADFVYPEHYKKHLKSHNGVKPYECEVCKRAFLLKEHRHAHRFTHSDRKLYECVTCHKGFMRKQRLLKHMEKDDHHNDSIIVNSNPLIEINGSLLFPDHQQVLQIIDKKILDSEKIIEDWDLIEEGIEESDSFLTGL